MPAAATVSRDLRDRQEQPDLPTRFQSEQFLPAPRLQLPLQVILPIRLSILYCLKVTREILELTVHRERTASRRT